MSTYRDELIGLAADRLVSAFHASRGILEPDFHERAAVRAVALVAGSGEGSEVDAARELATDRLIEQGFRDTVVTLFVDDTCAAGLKYAREFLKTECDWRGLSGPTGPMGPTAEDLMPNFPGSEL